MRSIWQVEQQGTACLFMGRWAAGVGRLRLAATLALLLTAGSLPLLTKVWGVCMNRAAMQPLPCRSRGMHAGSMHVRKSTPHACRRRTRSLSGWTESRGMPAFW